VPNIKSAVKRMKTSREQKLVNFQKRSRLKNAVRKVRKATTAEQARNDLNAALSLLDKSANKGILHPRTAARQKSRLTRHVRRMETS